MQADEQSFWERVERTSTCWLWIGPTTEKGYGLMSIRREVGWTSIRAHRYAYELLVGPIPDGLLIHHECRNRACVNPAHLRSVTNRENTTLGGRERRRDRCVRGHPLLRDGRDKGYCPTCRRRSQRERRARLSTEAARQRRERDRSHAEWL